MRGDRRRVDSVPIPAPGFGPAPAPGRIAAVISVPGVASTSRWVDPSRNPKAGGELSVETIKLNASKACMCSNIAQTPSTARKAMWSFSLSLSLSLSISLSLFSLSLSLSWISD